VTAAARQESAIEIQHHIERLGQLVAPSWASGRETLSDSEFSYGTRLCEEMAGLLRDLTR
jgi:hypothetical protein